MSDRQNPYFRAAMRNEHLQAECRESAARIQREIDEELATTAASPGPPPPGEPSESRSSFDRLRLQLLVRRELEDAERHARLREKMEPFL
jgi:hypothetical protein